MKVNILLATIVGAVCFFALGFLIFGLALDSFMKANTLQYVGLLKEPPNMIPLALADIVWAWLLAFIFDKWAGIRTFADGAIGGAIVMIAITLAIDLQYLAFMNLYHGYMPVIVDVIAIGVMSAITGGIIALILGKVGKETATA